MRILCVFGQHNYGDPRRGQGYEYTNFIPALRRLGHQVIFFESWDRNRYPDFARLNRSFLEVVEAERPDVVFSVMFTYEIWLETWELIREAGIAATVNWTTDDSWKYASFSRFLAPAFHAFTTTYDSAFEHYKSDGFQNVLLTQWAANAAVLQAPLAAADCKYQVSFVGTAHGARPRWIADLRRRGIHVDCFGHGWPAGPKVGPEILDIIRKSVISLNFADGAWARDGLRWRKKPQIKARVFEVPGAGGFLLTEWADGLERYYIPHREIALFQDVDELTTKIRHYLANPTERDRIAAAGFDRTRQKHLYDQRLREVLEFALRQRDSSDTRRGASQQKGINWEAFERAVDQHHRNWSLGFVKASLTAPCSLVWGPVRGPRAARRLLFELSWRMLGRHTYSAAGWPGRLFYEVS